MMEKQINRMVYRDKVYGCWTGKAAGGTLGAPYEWSRKMNDVTFYPPEINGANLPNDDLDLQLIWLAAAERWGALNVNERILAEYWSEMITGPWNEYGVCRNNIRMGILPPLSGSCGNDQWKWSNGAWIRSEIWACLFPGNPVRAAEAAYADACCDHCGEGIYAEILTAAMESAAFLESDIMKLIETGLSLIPSDSRIASAVRTAVQCHAGGCSLAEARNTVVKEVEDLGWFQAPGNVAFAILGLLYGAGDFGKTIACAVNCGDDADCTAGFAGALSGIILGRSRIPKQWTDPVGDSIQTCSIENTGRICVKQIPKNLKELTARVIDCAEAAAISARWLTQFTDGESSGPESCVPNEYQRRQFLYFLKNKSPYELTFDQPWGLISFDFENGPFIQSGKPLRIRISMKPYYSELMLVRVRLRLPEGWSSEPGEIILTSSRNPDYAEVTVVPGRIESAVTGLTTEIQRDDRILPALAVLPLIRSNSVAYTRCTVEMMEKQSAWMMQKAEE